MCDRSLGLHAGFKCLALISALALLADSLAPVAMLQGASTPAQPEISTAGVAANPPMTGISIPAPEQPHGGGRNHYKTMICVATIPGTVPACRGWGKCCLKMCEAPATSNSRWLTPSKASRSPTSWSVTQGLGRTTGPLRLMQRADAWSVTQRPARVSNTLTAKSSSCSTGMKLAEPPLWNRFGGPGTPTYGAIPATPALVAALKRLAAAQYSQFRRGSACSRHAEIHPRLHFPAAEYTRSEIKRIRTAVLIGLATPLDRRQLKWVVGGSARAPKDIDYLSVMSLPPAHKKPCGGPVKRPDGAGRGRLCQAGRWLVRRSARARMLVVQSNTLAGRFTEDAQLHRPSGACQGRRSHGVGRCGTRPQARWRTSVNGNPILSRARRAGAVRPDGMEPDGLDPAPAGSGQPDAR